MGETGVCSNTFFFTAERVWQPYHTIKTLTETTNIYIVVDKLSFEQNKTYRAQHIVKNAKGGTRVTNYNFTTNAFPHSGTCEADKTTIQAAMDFVNITCRDWIDEQPFLRYEAWILPHNTEPRLVYFGNSTSFKLRLPLGDSANNFTLKMEIKIFDNYESTSFLMNFTVSRFESFCITFLYLPASPLSVLMDRSTCCKQLDRYHAVYFLNRSFSNS